MFTKLIETIETLFVLGAVVLFFVLINTKNAHAQSAWNQCKDGREITRCETFDCPNGDTNSDGNCSFDDQGARLTDVRNDSFCSNPISGCGEVRYYASGENSSCSVRVEENNNNCDLYAISAPTFTPVPTSTPRPTVTPAASPSSTLMCSMLITTPEEGESPLKVKLEAKTTGSVNQIEEYEFSFTKPNGISGSVVQKTPVLNQTLQEVGTHKVAVSLISDGKKITSENCSKEIEVGNKAIGGGGPITEKTDKTLPETGSSLYVGMFLVALGFGGVYLYEKYRII